MRILLISAAAVAVAATLFVAYRAFWLAPNDAVAFYNRGNAYAAKAQYDRAIEDYDQAIRLDPKDADVFYNRGNTYLAKAQYDRAIDDYDQAIRLDPKLAPAFYNSGLAYQAKAQYNRAIENYDQAIRLDPKYTAAFNNRGLAYQAKAQYNRAIEDFDQAIRLDPKYAAAFDNRGITYFDTGKFAVADRDFEQSLSINAADAYGVLWLHLARVRSNHDDTEELTDNAAKFDLNRWPGPVLAFYLKRIDANDVMGAARSGDAKTQREQGCEASFYVGEDAVLRQDPDEAIRLLRQARETCPPIFVEYTAAEAELKRLEK
jgi:lipoprotein NlpI